MVRATTGALTLLLTVQRCVALKAVVAQLPERNGRCWKPDELVQNWETELRVNPEYLEHLRTLPPISKKIHLVWNGPDLMTMRSGLAVNGVQNLKNLNPDWEFRVYGVEEVDDFIKSHLSASDWEMLREAPLTPKTDIFRILKMYHEGGYYQDVDRLYNIPFDKIIEQDTKVLLPMNNIVDFTQDLMASSPGNRLYKRALEMYLCKMREQAEQGLTDWPHLEGEKLHIAATEAAGTYFAAVMESVFGRPIWGPYFHAKDDDFGAAFARHLVQLINDTPYMKSHTNEWCHEIIVEMPGCNTDPKYGNKPEMWQEARLGQWDR
jgi:hypothetical protein